MAAERNGENSQKAMLIEKERVSKHKMNFFSKIPNSDTTPIHTVGTIPSDLRP